MLIDFIYMSYNDGENEKSVNALLSVRKIKFRDDQTAGYSIMPPPCDDLLLSKTQSSDSSQRLVHRLFFPAH